jgi:nucleotide-binding universal stress UspA family protein
LSVLVGLDGSHASQEAMFGALQALGGRIGRLTLAFVIDFDSATSKTAASQRLKAESTLLHQASVARAASGIEPATIVVPGNPAVALADLAMEQGDDWIVIGTAGAGNADWLRGSTTTALAAASTPVMMISGPVDRSGKSHV